MYNLEIQKSLIGDQVRARYAMIIPILRGMLYSISQRTINEIRDGYNGITLEMFCKVYNEGDGDYGICFEYAVHEAIQYRNNLIYPKIQYVIGDLCGLNNDVESILFGAEKTKSNVLETAHNSLTEDSILKPGTRARPTYLKQYLDTIYKAHHNRSFIEQLPKSIKGVWKADLFLGSKYANEWVATTIKTNPGQIEEAPGLRIALYSDKNPKSEPYKHSNNLIYCPLSYDSDFMELFGASFAIAKHIINSKGKMPSRAALYYADDAAVAKWLTDRSRFPLLEILDALEALKQPDLLSAPQSIDDGLVIRKATPMPIIFE